MTRAWLLPVLVASAWSCASPAPPPPNLPRKLVILPVNNRTGDPLAVAGDGLLDRYVFRAETVTVADILEAEAGLVLRDKGFDPTPWDRKQAKGRIPTSAADAANLAVQAGVTSPCLYFEIRRWDPDSRVHVRAVIVDIEAILIEPASHRVLWQSSRRGPVPTPGQVLLEAASVAAARKATAELLAPWSPDPASPR